MKVWSLFEVSKDVIGGEIHKHIVDVQRAFVSWRSLGVAWSRSLRDGFHSFSLQHLRNEVCFRLLGVLCTTHGLHVVQQDA